MVREGLHLFRAFVAAIAVFAAVASRIPTTHCRCHDKKPVKSQAEKKHCPFAELRLLAAISLLAQPVELPARALVAAAVSVEAPFAPAVAPRRGVEARAPPRFFV